MADLLENIPDTEPYSRIKSAILKRTGKSDEEMLRELFTNITMGDRTSSQLLRYMKSSLGKHPMAELILRVLWMDRLPMTVAKILAPMSEDTALDQLVNSADRIYAKEQKLNSLYEDEKTFSKIRNLERVVADLRKQVMDIKFSLLHESSIASSLCRSRDADAVVAEEDKANHVCASTIAFGSLAKKYNSPCTFVKNQENGATSN